MRVTVDLAADFRDRHNLAPYTYFIVQDGSRSPPKAGATSGVACTLSNTYPCRPPDYERSTVRVFRYSLRFTENTCANGPEIFALTPWTDTYGRDVS